MTHVQIDVTAARAELSKLTDRTQAGETFELTKRGKVVALLVPPATPTQKVAKGMLEIAKQAEDQLNKTSSEEVDDWGLPVEPFPAVQKPAPKPPNPEPLKPWKQPMGLSKKQQAGQKYDR